MKSILDPSFRYTTSFNTDLRETFARVRAEIKRGDDELPAATSRPSARVLPLIAKVASRNG